MNTASTVNSVGPMASVVIDTGKPLLAKRRHAVERETGQRPGGLVGRADEVSRLRAHDRRRRGSRLCSLQNIDHTDAFSEADLRLLTTLTSSLSVALENARLFDETQRLLTETNERAAELAIINSVQQGLAAKLDMQSMYDLVGDKIAEIFDAQVIDIGIYDLTSTVCRYPYALERGDAATRRAGTVRSVVRRKLADTREAVRNRRRRCVAARDRRTAGQSHVGEPAKSVALRAARAGGKAFGSHLTAEPRPRRRVQRTRTCAC